jgi:hypothetical protein
MAVGVPTNEKLKDRKANGTAFFNVAAIIAKAAAANICANSGIISGGKDGEVQTRS